MTLSVRSNYLSLSLFCLSPTLDPICTFPCECDSPRLCYFSCCLYSISTASSACDFLHNLCLGKTGLTTHTHTYTYTRTLSCVCLGLVITPGALHIMRTSFTTPPTPPAAPAPFCSCLSASRNFIYFFFSIRVFLLVFFFFFVSLAHFQTFCFLIKFYVGQPDLPTFSV